MKQSRSSSTYKISLFAALLINLNIIIGAGVFLNVKPLIQLAGPLGFMGYALGAFFLLPFVYSLGKLAQAHPVAGGLYAYSRQHLHPFLGFISGWIYFVGKTVSAAFLAHAFASFFQNYIPFLQSFPTILLSSAVIFSLILLNIAGAHIGGPIQYLFFGIKGIPILFAIVFGLLTIKPINFFSSPIHFYNAISSMPIALYALMGFEITCSIGHMIKKQNIFAVIMGSFLIITTIYILFQTALFGALGLGALSSGEPITILANKIFTTPLVGNAITALVFASVISSAFGILTSNCWNLHTLIVNKSFYGEKLLNKVTKNNVPWVSLLIEGVIACLFLVISKNQIALQSMSVFGVVLSFLLCALAAHQATKKRKLAIWPIIPIGAIASCLYILFLCFQKIMSAGVSIPYIVLLSSGIIFAFAKKHFC